MTTEQKTEREDEGIAFFRALLNGLFFGFILPAGIILGVCKLIKMAKGH
jgi:hypothetical protein